MHWSPTDIASLMKCNYNTDLSIWKEQWLIADAILESKKQKWKKAVEKAPSLYDFLNKNFYS